MDAKGKFSSYEEVEFSILLTAPVTDWRALLRLITKMNEESSRYSTAWPLSGLVENVRQMLDKLDKTHETSITKGETS